MTDNASVKKLTDEYINGSFIKIHKQNKERGWWDDENRSLLTAIQLIITEIAEATEGDRKGLKDEHLPERKMAEVELADVFIRTADICGFLELSYVGNFSGYEGVQFNFVDDDSPLPVLHLELVEKTVEFAKAVSLYEYGFTNEIEEKACDLINTIAYIVENQNYDIVGAIEEKLEYNKKRLDHNREVRKAEGGKKY